ncbi:hypothetical protein WKI45_14930 [Delftia tsuruhatensis]
MSDFTLISKVMRFIVDMFNCINFCTSNMSSIANAFIFAIFLFGQCNFSFAFDGSSYRQIKDTMEFVDAYGKFIEKSSNSELIYLGGSVTDKHANGLVSALLMFMPQGAAYEPKASQEERERLTDRWGSKFCRTSFRGKLRSKGILIATGAIEIKRKRVSTALCPALPE